ncbi:hypothetical protein [Parasitella parasitica]|uniref:Uncharacterized protein n=1 Tax=Parasitella parasitica TaxID=35722 RepID=A0A0B7N3X8_9FUNG|nr:hypothetical protein [Parasitella parasitica]
MKGTTYSGCCYTLQSDDEDEIYDITRWPKNNGFYAKVPTLLYYRNKNSKLLDWGRGARLQSLKPDQIGTLLQYFKLALVQPDDVPLPKGKSPIDVISDFLRVFHEHVYEQLQNTKLLQDFRQEQYRYCLTVPAIWSDESKALMREASIKAGIIKHDDPIGRLELISEPEAAAAYCEYKYKSWNLSDGNIFMIVDAGGGTVDLITYLIEDDTPPRSLKEVTRGHGGMCGSAFIDQNMRKLLLSKLTGDMPTCVFEMMMDNFIQFVKPNYLGDEEYYLLDVPAGALPYIPAQLLKDGDSMVFPLHELRDKVFDPVLRLVVELVEQQINQAGALVDAIFLVGGFGCSSYLYDILKINFSHQVGEIAMPPSGELAIARGAAAYIKRPNLVTSKVLRRTYGVQSRLPFEEGLDPEDSAFITKDGIKRCSTRFDVIAKKGQRVSINQKIKRSYWIEYPKHTEADLYVTDQDIVPRQITDSSVMKLAEIPIKMPLLAHVKPGTRLDVTIEFSFGSTEIKMLICLADTVSEHVLDSADTFT